MEKFGHSILAHGYVQNWVFIAAFLLTVFFTIPVTVVQGIVQFQNTGKLARANATDTKNNTCNIYT